MQTIEAALARAAGGEGNALFLVGAPGIGKSHLARAAASHARDAGMVVAVGRCWETGGAPPGWPFRELFRTLRRERDLESAWLELREQQQILAHLVPELGANQSQCARKVELFEVIDAVLTTLRSLSAERALVLILEDLHAADRHTVDLLEAVTSHTFEWPVAVIGTYRSREARANLAIATRLAAAGRSAEVIPLVPFDRGDGERLARAVLGDGIEQSIIDEVVATSDGNPLFVIELARSMARTGGGAPPLSGLDHAIAAHLDSVSSAGRAVAELASLFGRHILHPLLVRCSEAAGVAGLIDEGLTELTRSEIVSREGDTWTFGHILVRDAFYERLPAQRRRELHAVATRELVRSGAHASEVAHHALAAAPEISNQEAIEHGRRAARVAIDSLALIDAAETLTRTVAIADATRVLPPLEHRRLQLELARVRVLAGDVAGGRELCLQVAASPDADAEAVAEAALIYGIEMTRGTVDQDMVRLLAQALDMLPPEPSPLRARVLARYATALYPHPDPEVPVRLAEEAIAMARRLDDPATLYSVVCHAHLPLFFWYRPVALRGLFSERLALARQHATRIELMRELILSVPARFMVGDAVGAEAALAEAFSLAERTRTPQQMYRVYLLRALAAVRTGAFAQADEWVARAEACSRDSPTEVILPTFFFTRFGHARLRRDTEYFRANRERIWTLLSPDHPNAIFFRVWLSAVVGDHDAARRDLQQAPRDYRGRPLVMMVLHAEAALILGDLEAAEHLYEELLPWEDSAVLWGMISFTAEGSVHAILALLAAALGRADRADEHFRRAVDIDTTSGARPALANTLEDWAQFLRNSPDPARRRRSGEVLRRAIALLEELGLDARAAAAREISSDTGAPVANDSTPISPLSLLQVERDGQMFTVRLGDDSRSMRGSKGMRYLEILTASPGREIHVLELVAAEAGVERGEIADSDAGPLIDAEAKEAYRQRLRDLDGALEEAAANMDHGRAESLAAERDALINELSRAVGLGGRDRKGKSTAERARVNVQRRLKSAVRAIAKESPDIGAHLDRALRTGTFCSYDPPAIV